MSQFQYCYSNANYDDIGQQDGGCGDNYSSLSGVDDCSQFGGMTNYQQGLLGLVPSYCNQSSDYAPIQGMYSATEIPAFAGLQYYPTKVGLVDGAYYAAPKIITTSGVAVPVAGQTQNAQAQQFINKVVSGADAALARNAAASAVAGLTPAKEGFYAGALDRLKGQEYFGGCGMENYARPTYNFQ